MSRPCSQTAALQARYSDNSPTRQAVTSSSTSGACSRTANQEKTCVNETDQPLPKWLIQSGRGWRRAVQNFTPSWFSVTMGTGIVSILLQSLSTTYASSKTALHVLSIIFFVLNVLLFTLIFLISVLRYTLYPATWTLMIRHPVQSLFLGTLPMGFATIINMFALVCVPRWGGASVQIVWAMWWIDVVLLPIVCPIVAAASGAIVADVLPNPQHALWTIVTSYVLWGIGVPLAMVVLVIYFHKLAVYKLPPQEVIVSVFLPLGPLGQGGFGIMQLGRTAMKIFPQTGTLTPAAGEILYVLGFGVAIVMWGFGLVWLFFAVASISRSKFPFNMGWWGFTFPIGVFTTSTLTMGEELPSAFFKILGTVFAICVMLLWLVVAAGTAKNMLYGDLIEAPCLREIEKARQTMLETETQLHV